MMAMMSSGRYCGRKMLRQGCFTLRAYCATDKKILQIPSITMASTSTQSTTGSKPLDEQATNDRTCRHCTICHPVETRKMGDDFLEPEHMTWGNLAGKLDVVELEAHVLRPSYLRARPQNLPH